MKLTVPGVDDFEVTGAGNAAAWNKAEWQTLSVVGEGKATYSTRAKVLYSSKGMYFLVECEDRILTCSNLKDGENLFTEDVVEVFLWPNEDQTLYFEYEISPLGAELPILVPNHGGRFHGWLPWHYEGERRIRKATTVRGGPRVAGANVSGWMSEFFFPFSLLAGLGNTPPRKGASWRGNIYRIDYDVSPCTQWAWCPKTSANFHNFRKFGTLVFG